MAVFASLRGGMGDSTVRRYTQENFEEILSQANDPSQQIDPDDITNVGGMGLTEFRKACNANFAQIKSDVGVVAVAAQGTLTVDTQPLADDTMTIGTKEYTFMADGTASADGEIDVGADLADVKTLIVAAINGTDGINTAHTLVTAGDFDSNDCVLTASSVGTSGNSIATTETFSAETNVFDAATLGTTTAGVDETITGLVDLVGGESWRTIADKLDANFTHLDSEID